MPAWLSSFLGNANSLENWSIYAGIVGGLLAAAFWLIRIYLLGRQSKKHTRDAQEHEAILCPDFDSYELKAARRSYVLPDCSQVDPANEEQMHEFASVRESIFSAADRFVADDHKRHLIVLADSGMGKTTFCLNYFGYFSSGSLAVALVSLARSDSVAKISKIPAKRSTVLLLDAFDEDNLAVRDGATRMAEILSACAEFKTVVLTCRSQFFENDAAIPRRTGISRIEPRSPSSAPDYELSRLYLMPFEQAQVDRYLKKKFPLLSLLGWRHRSRARALVERIPELSVRPMLLALVPDLIRENKQPRELYDLYDYMVEKWLERESSWISKETLYRVSNDLAMFLTKRKSDSGADRATLEDIDEASDVDLEGVDWSHLKTRSLLNRDSEGRFKFAHNSIREFLVVRGAISTDGRAFDLPWTEFMREIFVSYTRSENYDPDKAEALLVAAFAPTEPADVTLPVAEPLPEPDSRTAMDFRGMATSSARRRFGRADLPLELRRMTVRRSTSEGHVYLHDLEYDLIWRVVDTDLKQVGSDYSLYRSSLSDIVAKRFSAGYDLPSFPEFLSLLRLQSVIDLGIIRDYDFYWIGDRLSKATYMVASLTRTIAGEGITPVLNSVSISETDKRVNLYAVDAYRQRNTLSYLRALELQVRRGSLRRGYSDEMLLDLVDELTT